MSFSTQEDAGGGFRNASKWWKKVDETHSGQSHLRVEVFMLLVRLFTEQLLCYIVDGEADTLIPPDGFR